MDAVNAPAQSSRRARRELHTDDIAVGQRADVNLMNLDEHESDVIQPVDTPITNDYVAALAFNEQPVTIRIERSSEKFAPMWVDCWVQGKGAEVYQDGRWLTLNALPVGEAVTTRRKYVEVLARAKPDSVQTNVIERDNEDPQNMLQRFTSVKHPFSVIRDADPRGADWLTRILQEG